MKKAWGQYAVRATAATSVFQGRLEGCCGVGDIAYYPSTLVAPRRNGKGFGFKTYIPFLGTVAEYVVFTRIELTNASPASSSC